MTDNLLQKLEEKMTLILGELEQLRKENQRLQQENNEFKTKQLNHSTKLNEIISFLDAFEPAQA